MYGSDTADCMEKINWQKGGRNVIRYLLGQT